MAGARQDHAAPAGEAAAIGAGSTPDFDPESSDSPGIAEGRAVPLATPDLTPVEHVDATALGGGTAVRSAPSMTQGETVRTLSDRESVVILREVRGDRWVVGDQTWAMAFQDWSNLWYLIDGGYVYSGFVFIPRPNELETLSDRAGSHWVDVDLVNQTAHAMVGDRPVHLVPVTTGKPGFETPAGEHVIAGWGRRFTETMTSSQAGIQNPAEQYNVRNVLYTQYFDAEGDALHLNYWQPEGVFGRQRTSHGCVGVQLHDAQYLWLFLGPGARVSIHPLPVATRMPATPTVPAAGRSAAAATPTTATATPSSTPARPASPPAPSRTPTTAPPPATRTSIPASRAVTPAPVP